MAQLSKQPNDIKGTLTDCQLPNYSDMSDNETSRATTPVKSPPFKSRPNFKTHKIVEDSYTIKYARRIHITKWFTGIPMNTFILDFATPYLHLVLKFGYMRLPVAPFISNRLGCFQCQKYGHHQSNRGSTVCCANCEHTVYIMGTSKIQVLPDV